MSPSQNPSSSPPEKQCLREPSPPKRRARRPRSRRCLLKGCERIFRTRHPLARCCCSACREAARQWKKWKAQQRYRKSPSGREKRQAQCRRNRERHKAAGFLQKKSTCSSVARVIPIGFFFVRPARLLSGIRAHHAVAPAEVLFPGLPPRSGAGSEAREALAQNISPEKIPEKRAPLLRRRKPADIVSTY
jgi:hypothetical protein